MPLQSSVSALIGNRKRGLAISGLISKMQTDDPKGYQAVRSIENAVNDIYSALSDSPTLEELTVVDPNGAVLARIGDFEINGAAYSGAAFSQLWVGANADPAAANLTALPDGSLTIKNATFTLNAAATTTTIANVPTAGVGVVGLEVQDNVTHDAATVVPDAMVLYTTDPTNNLVAASMAHNGVAGIVRAYNGTGAGGLDTHGAVCIMDGSNGNVQAAGTISATGGFVSNGNTGVSGSLSFGTSVTLNTGSAITSVTGAGISTTSGTFVTGVTLNLTSKTFSGGLRTS